MTRKEKLDPRRSPPECWEYQDTQCREGWPLHSLVPMLGCYWSWKRENEMFVEMIMMLLTQKLNDHPTEQTETNITTTQ